LIGGPPKPSFVIRYLYDWSTDGAAVPPSAEKERPAVIILSVTKRNDRILVRVAPITHRMPDDMARAMEIPPLTKARLGLDGQRSWVILDHANEFIWPGPDVRPVPGRDPATIYYGPLPPAFYDAIKQKLLGLLRLGRARARIREQ
jgi:PemK-like, MazF-like toxin of type II toxin-antitoxin system